MLKQVTETVEVCDFCQTVRVYGNGCLLCDRRICPTCMPNHGKEYARGVHWGGTGDAIYCLPCDTLPSTLTDPLHQAYVAIQSLRDEAKGWATRFQIRADEAERLLTRLLVAQEKLR